MNNIFDDFYKIVPFNKIAATVKYIISPVTSTNVATSGADEVAGSNLNFFKTIGIIEPLNVPHMTIPMRERKIVSASLTQ